MTDLSTLRSLVASSLAARGQVRLAERLQHCEADRMMVRENGAPITGALAVRIGCNVRVCPRCQARKGRKVGMRWSSRLRRLAGPSRVSTLALVTLTVRTRPDWGLREAHAALYACIRALRMDPCHRQFWRSSVVGGLWARHQTRTAHGWHAHLHLVLQLADPSKGKDTGQAIVKLWREECETRLARPDGKSVTVQDAQDVRILKGERGSYDAIRYATTYSTSELVAPEHAADVARELHCVRQHGTWLQWHASSKGPVAEQLQDVRRLEPKMTCVRLADLQLLPEDLAAGPWSRSFTWRRRFTEPWTVPVLVEDLEAYVGCELGQDDLQLVLGQLLRQDPLEPGQQDLQLD